MTPRRLGTVLQKERAAKRMTQAALAKRARVARGYLAKLEAGYATNPSLAILKRLARALGVPAGELLE